MNKTSSVDWAAIEAQPAFRALLARKSRFIISATIFFVAYYFALPVLVGWFPTLMKQVVFGVINLAYLFALSQFFMAWTLAFIYTRTAAQWDIAAAQVIKNH
ncbi:MAG: DUF485 domain-containing protein [Gammaproteobacteria bacterium]|nr:DUF485 domain-containing protein [Gammaproteobacteria bacterium]